MRYGNGTENTVISETEVDRDDRNGDRSYRNPDEPAPERAGDEAHPDRLGIREISAPVARRGINRRNGDPD